MKKIFAFVLTSLLLVSAIAIAPMAQSEGVFSKSKFNFLSSEPELLPVNEAFSFDFKQQGNQLKISWVIADGYYMYRDKLTFAADGAVIGDINLPRGKTHTDEYFGEQEVFYSFVAIPVGIKEASNEATFKVTFMGCAEGTLCYPPTTRDVIL